jgi:hypothetical protein
MQERAASGDAASVLAAARRTLVPWSAALADLQRWFDVHAASIWPTDAQGQARARVDLLQQTIDALARGEPVLAAPGAARAPATRGASTHCWPPAVRRDIRMPTGVSTNAGARS